MLTDAPEIHDLGDPASWRVAEVNQMLLLGPDGLGPGNGSKAMVRESLPHRLHRVERIAQEDQLRRRR
jgi:hypothetical protein